jgi:hypothetical protein
MSLPSPTAIWTESPTSRAAVAIARLTPYKTPAGYWVFVTPGHAPAGSMAGAFVDGAYLTLDTRATAGMRIARAPAGFLIIY